MIRGNSSVCIGTSCALGWVPLAKYLAVVCYLDWRFEKKHGVYRGLSLTKDQAEPFSTLRSKGSV
ncbi:hypothetical protein FCULG_00012874 [Fusarium culmorum]|uniref:Uncharacterized protein n=1 Tax=Fusarium culmorum TaxID=5516 RepID=A0A2T4GFY1_FUSCU|nr:hypothetical protein FCULG_00012874 [Fusarium culmorum]